MCDIHIEKLEKLRISKIRVTAEHLHQLKLSILPDLPSLQSVNEFSENESVWGGRSLIVLKFNILNYSVN
jgi:hypothetical protein